MKINNVEITGTGSYIPVNTVTNQDFSKNKFFDEHGEPYEGTHEQIARKFKVITGIEERRYVNSDQVASDIATIAGKRAIEDAGIDPETLDQVIVAHNFGDVKKGTIQTDILPSLASRVKHQLGIENAACVAYDVLFGCPGWIQGIIQSTAYIKAGMARKCLVIATETLSRVLDMHDRDSMIFADGAGACIVEATSGEERRGVLGMESGTWTTKESHYLFLGKGNTKDADPKVRYIKMHGRKIYEFALTQVPVAMKSCLDKAGIHISDISKILIHQANEKMDKEIVKRLYNLFDEDFYPPDIMPMSIHKLGNSSVSTVPTLLDQILKGENEENHEIKSGDIVLLASVGAGMNINAITYRF
jgi:3-oxoacyl-[acyl-carrier-protein] synthase-3